RKRLAPRLTGTDVGGIHLRLLREPIGCQRLTAFRNEQCLVEAERRRGAARGHRVVVGHGGGDDGAEGDEQNCDEERDSALMAPRAHWAISKMRTILPQSVVSRVTSTAMGRRR